MIIKSAATPFYVFGAMLSFFPAAPIALAWIAYGVMLDQALAVWARSASIGVPMLAVAVAINRWGRE